MLTLSKPLQHKAGPIAKNIKKFGGAKRDRTADLYNAIVALSQLSYSPVCLSGWMSQQTKEMAHVAPTAIYYSLSDQRKRFFARHLDFGFI